MLLKKKALYEYYLESCFTCQLFKSWGFEWQIKCKNMGLWVWAHATVKKYGVYGCQRCWKRGSFDPYICVASRMGLPPPDPGGRDASFPAIAGIPVIWLTFLQFPAINSYCITNATIIFQVFSCRIVAGIPGLVIPSLTNLFSCFWQWKSYKPCLDIHMPHVYCTFPSLTVFHMIVHHDSCHLGFTW